MPAPAAGAPSTLAVAATWDPQAAASWGAALGEETRRKGAGVLLGPRLDLAVLANEQARELADARREQRHSHQAPHAHEGVLPVLRRERDALQPRRRQRPV